MFPVWFWQVGLTSREIWLRFGKWKCSPSQMSLSGQMLLHDVLTYWSAWGSSELSSVFSPSIPYHHSPSDSLNPFLGSVVKTTCASLTIKDGSDERNEDSILLLLASILSSPLMFVLPHFTLVFSSVLLAWLQTPHWKRKHVTAYTAA